MSKTKTFIELCKTSDLHFTTEQLSFLESKLETVLPKSRTKKETESKESTPKTSEKPKKQPNVYSVFTKDQTQKLIAEGITNFKDRSTVISQRWKELSDEEKKSYKTSVSEKISEKTS